MLQTPAGCWAHWLAAVNGLRGNTPWRSGRNTTLYYIENWSPWLDVKIVPDGHGGVGGVLCR